MVYTADRALKGDAYKLDTVKAGLFITKTIGSNLAQSAGLSLP